MTRGQIRWAQDHDWFFAVIDNEDNTFTAVVTGDDGLLTTFKDFKALKAWAGY